MAEHILTTWESPNLVELVTPVASLLESLPFPPHQGSFHTGFNDWGVAAELSLLPHRGRYSCAFEGDNLPLDVFAEPHLGEAHATGESMQVWLSREYLSPRHGYRGERESHAHVSVTEFVPAEGWVHRKHDPAIVDVLNNALHEEKAVDATTDVHLASSGPSRLYDGRAVKTYVGRAVPVAHAAKLFRSLCRRFVPAPHTSLWEVVGPYADVQKALASEPPGAKRCRTGATCLGGELPISPWFAIERCAFMRPAWNFELAHFHDLAAGLSKLTPRLVRPELYFGPVIWPSRELAPLPIYYNHVKVRFSKGAWRVLIGIWKENDDDPEVREVRKFVEPMVNAVQPTKLKKTD